MSKGGKPEDEIKKLRERVVAAEIALMMFVAKEPRIEPRKMLQAYLMSYPKPLATPRAIEMCVAAKEHGQHLAKAGRIN